MALRVSFEDASKLLLVEDSPADERLVRELLADAGLPSNHVVRASRLVDAVRLAAKEKFAIALLDLNLPDSQGIETLEQIVERFPDLPIIVLTGSDDEAVALRAVQRGAQDYLQKGFLEPSLLAQSIRYAIDRHRMLVMLKAYSRELEEKEASLRRIFEDSTDGVLIVDRGAHLRFANRAAERMLGRCFGELDARVREQLVNRRDGDTVTIESESGPPSTLEIRSAQTYWGREKARLLILHDITEQWQTEQRLRSEAARDPLTNLANRSHFVARLRRRIERAARSPSDLFALIYMDLDRFKAVNDTLGHAAGDRLLKHVADCIAHAVRDVDTVARLGGDEFTVLLDKVHGVVDTVRVVRRIQQSLAEPTRIEGQELRTLASMGIVLGDASQDDPLKLLRDADAALYRVKQENPGSYRIYDEELHARALRELMIERDLRPSLERGEFEIHYLPILGARNERVLGLEALLRWRHPEVGLVEPVEFLRIAESSGFIARLGDYALDQTFEQIKRWCGGRVVGDDLDVSINLTTAQILDQGFLRRFAESMERSAIASPRVTLDLDARMIERTPERAEEIVRFLRSLEVNVSLDRFGEQSSSLDLLSRFEFSEVKLSRALVARIDREERALSVVQGLVEMAHRLSMRVVATGIETESQAALSREIGCDRLQGFLFGRPRPAQELRTILLRESVSGRSLPGATFEL